MGAFFYIMKICKLLRVPVEVELAGLDISKHGGSAYDGGEAGKVSACGLCVSLGAACWSALPAVCSLLGLAKP